MDDDAERGLIFILGMALGLVAMWLVFTARGRKTAQQVFEAAGDFADDLSDTAGDVLESAGDVAGNVANTAGRARRQFSF